MSKKVEGTSDTGNLQEAYEKAARAATEQDTGSTSPQWKVHSIEGWKDDVVGNLHVKVVLEA